MSAAGKGSVVLLTGAARGLGRAMTRALVASGNRVAAIDLDASGPEMRGLVDECAALGASERLLPVEADITRAQDCEAAVERAIAQFGTVHGLVNNAGRGMQDIGNVQVGPRKRFYEVAPEAWTGVIDVNLNGAFMMARAIAPRLVEQGWGRIVNVVTSTGTMQAVGFSPYGPSKAGLEAATVIWSKDLDGTGVTVNALLPGGAANTRMIPASEISDRSKLVQPDVMCAPVVWLMSSASDGVNGRRIVANKWDTRLSHAQALAAASAPAGWVPTDR